MHLPSLSPLDSRLVLPKPIEETPHDVVGELADRGHLIIERKRNGHAAPVAITGDKTDPVGIYSRSIKVLTSKFPHHVEAVRALSIPPGTLLQGEFTLAEKGVENPALITRIAGSKAERAVVIQNEIGVPTLSFFNVLVYRGESVAHLPYLDRLDIVRQLCQQSDTPLVEVVEVLETSLEKAQALSIKNNWEGLVLYDAGAPTRFDLSGKSDQPPRPYGCWKWKDYNEGDFVATGWLPSTSKKFKGLVRDLKIAQRNPVTGALESWGKVGVGLSAKERAEFTDVALYPMVFEIKFESRTKNKRLIAARILRRRSDKEPHECFAPY